MFTDTLKLDGRKWNMAQLCDNLDWPLKEEYIKKYSITVRELEYNTKGSKIRIKDYSKYT